MEKLLYYPGFEIANQNWLKFALLYVDQLRPIHPPDVRKYLKKSFRELMDSTDLIIPYHPDYDVAYRATLDTIQQCEYIVNHSHLFENIFKTTNIRELWQHPYSHMYTIFRDKYTSELENFVVTERFGTRVKEGIAVSMHFKNIFMSLLAQAISLEEEIPPITDKPKLDEFSIKCLRSPRPTDKGFQVAKGIINLTLPANIDSIPIKNIINIRNKDGFKDRLHAFHSEIMSYIQSVEEGIATCDFFESRGSIFKDFSDEIASLGVGLMQMSLSVWLLANSSGAAFSECVKELIAGTGFSISSIISIRNGWERTKAKRYTRKYMADIKKLESDI
ncbi:MAG: hypothetical protein JXM79_05880 [Sedimentisphaerales bacterium]|nr:hypothetical protein [Sedimentisphaerales bacterium]